VKRMLELCKNPKHKLILELLYGCGLRNSELRSLLVADIDCERQMIHVRNGKGGKDRYVPMGYTLAKSIKRYMKRNLYDDFLFTTQMSIKYRNGSYSGKGLQWIVRHAALKAGIRKKVSV